MTTATVQARDPRARHRGANRFYAGGPTFRPGLIRVAPGDGAKIEVELWDMPLDHVGSFLAGIPAPLGLGTITLEDGTSVKSFICEGIGIEGATDITAKGSWRVHIA